MTMMNNRKSRRGCYGKVVSDKMDKTVVVQLVRLVAHPLYGKVVRRITKVKAHDEKKEAQVGDWVEIVECRPISKTKHMALKSILKKIV